MMKLTKLLLLITLIFASMVSNAQADGSILSKVGISKDSLINTFSKFKNPERFVVKNKEGLDWNDAFKFLDDFVLYKIIYFSVFLNPKSHFLISTHMADEKSLKVKPAFLRNNHASDSFHKTVTFSSSFGH